VEISEYFFAKKNKNPSTEIRIKKETIEVGLEGTEFQQKKCTISAIKCFSFQRNQQ